MIYLAGKVQGPKWQLARDWCQRSRIKSVADVFVASDGSDHSEHFWGGAPFEYSAMPEDINTYFVSVAAKTVGTIAYVETSDSYGTIAELAYRSAFNVPQFLIVRTFTEEDGDFDRDMYDAYWFVSNFPNVTAFEVDSWRAAHEAFNRCCDSLVGARVTT